MQLKEEEKDVCYCLCLIVLPIDRDLHKWAAPSGIQGVNGFDNQNESMYYEENTIYLNPEPFAIQQSSLYFNSVFDRNIVHQSDTHQTRYSKDFADNPYIVATKTSKQVKEDFQYLERLFYNKDTSVSNSSQSLVQTERNVISERKVVKKDNPKSKKAKKGKKMLSKKTSKGMVFQTAERRKKKARTRTYLPKKIKQVWDKKCKELITEMSKRSIAEGLAKESYDEK